MTNWPGSEALRGRFEAVLNDVPTEPGIYAVRQWYGWRILEWHEGAWWHIGRVSTWPKKAEIDAFVGPLPVIARDYSVIEKDFLEPENWEAQFPDAPSPAGQVFDL